MYFPNLQLKVLTFELEFHAAEQDWKEAIFHLFRSGSDLLTFHRRLVCAHAFAAGTAGNMWKNLSICRRNLNRYFQSLTLLFLPSANCDQLTGGQESPVMSKYNGVTSTLPRVLELAVLLLERHNTLKP